MARFDLYRISTLADLETAGFFRLSGRGRRGRGRMEQRTPLLFWRNSGPFALTLFPPATPAAASPSRGRSYDRSGGGLTGKTASTAIVRDGVLVYENYLAAGLTHSESLVALCDDALRAAKLHVRDVDLFAVTYGPGSFLEASHRAGSRKGLAMPRQTPCVGVSTLEALAWGLCTNSTALCALDARRGRVYYAAFSVADGTVTRLCEDASAPAAQLEELIMSLPRPVWCFGDGAPLYGTHGTNAGRTFSFGPRSTGFAGRAVYAVPHWRQARRFLRPSLFRNIIVSVRQNANVQNARLHNNREEGSHMNKPIALGADHGGWALKEAVKQHLDALGVAYQVLVHTVKSPWTIPTWPFPPARPLSRVNAKKALLFCGTGVGISIAANKVKGIRACCCSDTFSAKYTRMHNDANVLCMGGRVVGAGLACELVDVFLNTEFEGGRHARRIAKITEIENR